MNSPTSERRFERQTNRGLVSRAWPEAARPPAKTQRASPAVDVSDEELRLAIRERLRSLEREVARRVQISVRGGAVVLTGFVRNVAEQRTVLEAVQQVAGVKDLIDRLRGGGLSAVRRPAVAQQRTQFKVVVPRRWLPGGFFLASLALGGWVYNALPTAPVLPQVVPAAGSVSVAGQPAPGVFLTLHPLGKNPDQVRPHGRVNAQGKIEWTTFERGDGAPVGEYVVTAIWNRAVLVDGERRPGPNVLPLEFSRPETTPLRVSVKAKSDSPLRIELPQ